MNKSSITHLNLQARYLHAIMKLSKESGQSWRKIGACLLVFCHDRFGKGQLTVNRLIGIPDMPNSPSPQCRAIVTQVKTNAYMQPVYVDISL